MPDAAAATPARIQWSLLSPRVAIASHVRSADSLKKEDEASAERGHFLLFILAISDSSGAALVVDDGVLGQVDEGGKVDVGKLAAGHVKVELAEQD